MASRKKFIVLRRYVFSDNARRLFTGATCHWWCTALDIRVVETRRKDSMKTNVRRYGSLLLVMGAGVAAFALSLNVNPGSGRFASLGIPEATACWKAVSRPAENYCECEEADNYNIYSCSAHTSDVKECTVWWPVQIGC